MAPSIGRIVVYTQPETEQPFNGHRDHPAIVTHVWSDTCVNLKVFFDCGPTDDRTSAVLGQHWDWPARV